MKKLAMTISTLIIVLCLGTVSYLRADTYDPTYSEPEGYGLLAPDELTNLLAPIALYPDPLIAQILPAATFVDQIQEAARYVRRYGVSPGIEDQPWDVSVKAVAHYPDVLYMMENRSDWTVALGQAYIDQPREVMDAIQRLRAEARAQGNLYSTPQQQVIVSGGVISIVPATSEYVYVPVYDPQVIYYQPYDPYYPFVTFGTGFFIGAWLSRDCDWRRHRVYYHGWRGGGWVGRARPHIHDRRGVYINRRAASINVNNRVLQHDNREFRQQLRNEGWRRRQGPAMRPGRPGGGIEQRRGPGGEGHRRGAAGTPPASAAPARAGGAPAPAGASRSFSTSGQATGGAVAPGAVPPAATPAPGRAITAPAAAPATAAPAAVPSATAPAAAPVAAPSVTAPATAPAAGASTAPTSGQRGAGSRRPRGRSGGDANSGRSAVTQPATAVPVAPAAGTGTGGRINRRGPAATQGVSPPAAAAPATAAPTTQSNTTPRSTPTPRHRGGQTGRGDLIIQRGSSAPATAATPRPPAPAAPRSSAPVTTVPRSAAPVTTVPRSSAPVTTVPRATAPATTVPRSAAPVTTVPRSTAPVVVPRTTPSVSVPHSAPPVTVPRSSPVPAAIPRAAPAPAAAPRATAPMVVPRASTPAAPAAPAFAPHGLPAGMRR